MQTNKYSSSNLLQEILKEVCLLITYLVLCTFLGIICQTKFGMSMLSKIYEVTVQPKTS